MPNVDRECVTHHHACDCQEAKLQDEITTLTYQRNVFEIGMKGAVAEFQKVMDEKFVVVEERDTSRRHRDMLLKSIDTHRNYEIMCDCDYCVGLRDVVSSIQDEIAKENQK